MTTVPIRVRVDGALSWEPRAAPGLTAALRDLLTVPDPDYLDAVRQGRSTHGLVATRCHLRAGPSGTVRAPRGALDELRRRAAAAGVQLAFDAAVTRNPDRPPRGPDAHSGVALRPYQATAVDAMLTGVQGLVVAPPGSGKTVLGACAVVRSLQAALVLVPTVDIAAQWADALARAGAWRTRRLYGAKAKSGGWSAAAPGEVAVATVQGAWRAGRDAGPLLGSVGAVVVDEAHHSPSRTYADLLDRCPARYRWGLTATPTREDALDPLLPLLFGRTLYRVGVRDLVAGGWLVAPRVVAVRTGWAPAPTDYDLAGRLDYAKAQDHACRNPGRTALAVELATEAVSHGRRVLVLVPRVDAAGRLAARLRGAGLRADVLTSDVPARARRRRLADLRAGRLDAVVATSLADEGLDVPALDCVVLLGSGRKGWRAAQRVGRLMRPQGQPPVAFDFVDGGPFVRQWSARAAAYRAVVGVGPVGPVGSVAEAIAAAGWADGEDGVLRQRKEVAPSW